ncbi:MAG: hypothetical protein A2798_03590 [Candidatus Levybacteria bacterium RIFCSPHIGHO2_01_FULL_37_17]|nr:MAG: hypothetical protein A2798_03590 [Candidatus Levybacteria bacterium RIFCSPHIGHO2_01_FULL_37_17]OGH36557.1 MAG: hypothetical protein A2959_03645 [Candidatus Levybacteria bacterium RIFCSPLOWO2_01_FULL_38_23]
MKSYKVFKVIFNSLKFKIFVFLLLSTFYFQLSTRNAFAQSVSLGIFPPVMEIDATSPAEVKSKFSLENPTEQSLDIIIQLKAFKASTSNNGQIEILDTFESFPDPLLINRIKIKDKGISIRSFTLSPKQKKEFDFEVNIPPNEAKGDYYFTVFFATNPKPDTISNSSLASAGVAMNVLLSVGPKGETKGFIDKFSSPLFIDSGPVPFTVQVENASDHFVPINGEIIIENLFGQKVGKVKLLSVNVLAGSQRLIPDETQIKVDSAEFKEIEKTITSSNYPVAIWPEKFLIGPYKANLSLTFGENGEKFSRSVSFFAFPATYLAVILIVLGIVVFIVLRVKNKIN